MTSENPQIKRRLNKVWVTTICIVLFILTCALTTIFVTLDQIKTTAMINQKSVLAFKKLSSDEIINEIYKLPINERIAAYKAHSALVEEAGKVWQGNLQDKDFTIATEKSLPILISRNWQEDPARDILLWMLVKSSIIVLRPGGGCQGTGCPKSDQEIANKLKESFNLSMKIINGVFQELEIDNGGALNFKPLLDFSAFENKSQK